ncbi:hypothetical protein LPB41_16330 [Thalassospira sp. MA62]|nr:hypothetical protein [Thalassospira sp. MA62]
MGQGMFGGATPYGNQSLKDIQDDIKKWEFYANEINALFNVTLKELEDKKYKQYIPFNILVLFLATIQTTVTFAHDFQLISSNIKNSNITSKDVRLLRNIGKLSEEYNRNYGKEYHSETRWHDYENPDFRRAEKLYQDGRNLFLNLQSAENAAARLEDYMDTESSRNTFIVNGTGHTIQQGTGNRMTVNIEHSPTSIDREEAERLLTQLLVKLDEYFTEEQEQERDDAKDYIEVIQDQIAKENPKNSMLKTALKGLVALNGPAGFASSVITISQFFGFTPN